MLKSFFIWFVLKFYFPGLGTRIFNRKNLTKVFIIFIVGFISRLFIASYFDVNVFLDFTNSISLIYYSFMSFFVVFVHEFVSYFDLSIFPKINFYALKLSSIKEASRSLFSHKMFIALIKNLKVNEMLILVFDKKLKIS